MGQKVPLNKGNIYMNKIFLIGIAIFGLSACNDHDHSKHAHSKEEHMKIMEENASTKTNKVEETKTYICPMHPHIKGQKGDNCPICGMHLTPQKSNEVKDNNEHRKMDMKMADESNQLSSNISKQKMQNSNIKTTTVLFGEITQSFTAFARVVSQNKLVEDISMRDNGWIENIANIEPLSQVQQGDFLFNFYSPEIKSAQIDYIIALNQNNKSQAQSSIIRLQNLGVQNKAIEELTKNKKVTNTTNFYAPISGYIKKLNITKGQFVKLGYNAITIQNNDKLLVEAFIDKEKLSAAKNSFKTEIINESGKLKLIAILPEIDPTTQNYIARLELKNSNLKQGDYIDVKFYTKAVKGLVIPKQSVLIDSGRYYVFVANNNKVTAKMLTTGAFDDNNIIAETGLKEGDKVITNGQFLVDSEAKLQSSFNSMGDMTHNH
jgi:membrane fusion protein, copper/silver efflux system